jgi:hypothetical protein
MKPTTRLALYKVRTMQGRQGEAWSADVYWDGEHVGEVIDSANGGEIDLRVYPSAICKEIHDHCNELWEEKDDIEDFGDTGASWKGDMTAKLLPQLSGLAETIALTSGGKKGKIRYSLKGDSQDGVRVVTLAFPRAVVRDLLIKKHGDALYMIGGLNPKQLKNKVAQLCKATAPKRKRFQPQS